MLFVFDAVEVPEFWMKNTLIPLSIGFFSRDRRLVDVQEMAPESLLVEEPRKYISRHPALFALEAEKGWFKKHKINLGAKLKLMGTVSDRRLKEIFK